jgi:hypothetical protein
MLAIAADPRRLGAHIGFLAVLHTWNQQAAIPSPSALCGSFLASAFRKKRLRFAGAFAHLATPSAFDRFLRQLRSKSWVVYAKRPFGGPKHVIRYLARYTHRAAISSGRLIEMKDGQVTFRWRDSVHGNEQKLMTLDAVELIRRHFGFLANRNRREDLTGCRALLPTQADQPPDSLTEKQRNAVQRRCPICQAGTLRIVDWIAAAALTACAARAQASAWIRRDVGKSTTPNTPGLAGAALDVCLLPTKPARNSILLTGVQPSDPRNVLLRAFIKNGGRP